MSTGSPALCRDAAGCELFGAALRRFGRLRLRAGGTSMLPVIHPGDILTIHAVSHETIGEGDVVLFRHASRLVAHRVVESSSDGHLTTRGDALQVRDAPVPLAAVIGRVSVIQRGPLRLSPRTRPNVWLTVASFVVDVVRLLRSLGRGATRRLRLGAA